MNREASTSSALTNAAPRAPRRYKSSTKSSDFLLGHIQEQESVDPATAAPCRTKSSDELDEDLLNPYPHTENSNNNNNDDDVSMQDADMDICNDVASVGSFSHCSGGLEGGERRTPVVAMDDSMVSFSRPRRHVSTTESCLSLYSTDSLHQMRFIAPNNSFTPQDIIMMEEQQQQDEQQRIVIRNMSSSSFRLMKEQEEEDEDHHAKNGVDDKTANKQQQQATTPPLWKTLPFATNQGLPDFHSSAVSYEEGETTAMATTPLKPPVQRKTSIYRAPPPAVTPSSS